MPPKHITHSFSVEKPCCLSCSKPHLLLYVDLNLSKPIIAILSSLKQTLAHNPNLSHSVAVIHLVTVIGLGMVQSEQI